MRAKVMAGLVGFVGWAKPTGPREARPDDKLRVPTELRRMI